MARKVSTKTIVIAFATVAIGIVLCILFVWQKYNTIFAETEAREFLARGDRLFAEKNYTEAIPIYQSAKGFDSTTWRAMHKIGICYRELGELKPALKELREALKVCPADYCGDVKLSLVETLFRRGTPADAASSLSLLKGIEGKLPGEFNYQLLLGKVYRKLGSFDASLGAFKMALSFNPKSAIAYSELGLLFAKNKKFETAVKAFSKAITLDEKYAPAYEGRAKCYHALHQAAKAQPDEEKFFELTKK